MYRPGRRPTRYAAQPAVSRSRSLAESRTWHLTLWSLLPRFHQDTCYRIQVVSTCCRQHVSCIGNKIAASLSPIYCWIQRDTSRLWHKWIVIMSPRYSLHVYWTSNLYPSTYVSGYKLLVRDTRSLSGRHVSWCCVRLTYSLNLKFMWFPLATLLHFPGMTSWPWPWPLTS